MERSRWKNPAFVPVTAITVRAFFAPMRIILPQHGSHDDTPVMICVLTIVFSRDTIA
jgi:hypothetical protein